MNRQRSHPFPEPRTPFGRSRRRQTHADVLVWQGPFRASVAFGLWALTLGLADFGSPWRASVAAMVWGQRNATIALTALVFAYMLVSLVVSAALQRTRQAPMPLVIATTLVDVLVIFAGAYLCCPAAYYDRTLLIVFFVLQVTQIYFGRATSFTMVGATIVAYLAIVMFAAAHGAVIQVSEEGFTLMLFVAGAGMFAWLYGDLSRRLDALAGMFERAEVGDFAQSYDVAADRRPDSITLVGRAYNRMRDQLSTIMLTDPLSGCLNRRGFDQELMREVVRTARQGEMLGLIAVDVDHFKRINDTFGHLAGDTVIREVGQLLRDTARGGDVVARTGGDEFIVIATETSPAGVAHLASRIAEGFRARTFGGVQGQMPITASIGVVAETPRSVEVTEDLRARADEALYAAKRGGRNRVVVWTDGVNRTGAFAIPVEAVTPLPLA